MPSTPDADVKLRPLTLDRAGEALTVQRAAFISEGRAYNLDIPPLTETLDEIRAAIGASTVVGAFLGPRLVGSARLNVDGTIGWVSRVAVAPDQQGRGLGRRLVTGAMEAAPDGVTSFRLAAAAGSTANLGLYSSIGFVEIDRTVDVAGVDMIIMEAPR